MTKACELDSHGLYGNTPKALIGHTGRTMIGNRTSTHHTTVDDTNVALESKQKLQYFVFKCSKFTQTLQKTVWESLKKTTYYANGKQRRTNQYKYSNKWTRVGDRSEVTDSTYIIYSTVHII